MTKNIFKLLLIVAPMVAFVGCKDDDDVKPAPSLSVDPTTTSALPGDEVTFNVTVNAPNGGKNLIAMVGATQLATVTLDNQTSATKEVKYSIPANAVIGSKIALTFQATDNSNLTSIATSSEITVNDPIIILSGNLTTQTLDAGKRYLIRGQTFVRDGITITIPPGTVLFGEKATKGTLVVDRGGKLLVNGEADAPVVMTSNQEVGARDRGDWGGLVILGKAFTNQPDPAIEGISPSVTFGGADRTNDNDNSGVYRYLRVEYAGIELTPNNETNSVTMGGVGSGTVMEYIQVSFGGDDGFEWFGGSVNGKYLVSLSTWDDDFDVDYGYSGNVQFGLAVRNPFAADQSQSNAFETDNGPGDGDTGVGTYTTGTFSNFTIYGPLDRVGRSLSANNVHTMDMRRRTAVSIFNSVMGGFPTGLRFNHNSVYDQYTSNPPNGVLANNLLIAGGAGSRYAVGSAVTPHTATDVQAYWEAGNEVVNIPASGTEEAFYADLGLRVENFFARHSTQTYPSNPNFTLSKADATIATGGDFTHEKFDEAGRAGFFEAVDYQGAFGATDWTDGWTEFRPIQKAY